MLKNADPRMEAAIKHNGDKVHRRHRGKHRRHVLDLDADKFMASRFHSLEAMSLEGDRAEAPLADRALKRDCVAVPDDQDTPATQFGKVARH